MKKKYVKKSSRLLRQSLSGTSYSMIGLSMLSGVVIIALPLHPGLYSKCSPSIGSPMAEANSKLKVYPRNNRLCGAINIC